MTAIVLVIGAALLCVGCGVRVHGTASASTVSPCAEPRACADGRPVFLIQSLYCQGGICGYTCAPDRWTRDAR